MVIRGAIILLWPGGFPIGATINELMTSLKLGAFEQTEIFYWYLSLYGFHILATMNTSLEQPFFLIKVPLL